MKRTLLGMAEAGEPLLKQALEAIRAYNEAMAQADPRLSLSAFASRQITCTKL